MMQLRKDRYHRLLEQWSYFHHSLALSMDIFQSIFQGSQRVSSLATQPSVNCPKTPTKKSFQVPWWPLLHLMLHWHQEMLQPASLRSRNRSKGFVCCWLVWLTNIYWLLLQAWQGLFRQSGFMQHGVVPNFISFPVLLGDTMIEAAAELSKNLLAYPAK